MANEPVPSVPTGLLDHLFGQARAIDRVKVNKVGASERLFEIVPGTSRVPVDWIFLALVVVIERRKSAPVIVGCSP